MKHTALALVLLAAASTAHADRADSSTLLRCGVIFGGKSLTYDAGDEKKDRNGYRTNAVPGTPRAEPLKLASMAAADIEADPIAAATSSSDTRLPRKLTLATVGCSW